MPFSADPGHFLPPPFKFPSVLLWLSNDYFSKPASFLSKSFALLQHFPHVSPVSGCQGLCRRWKETMGPAVTWIQRRITRQKRWRSSFGYFQGKYYIPQRRSKIKWLQLRSSFGRSLGTQFWFWRDKLFLFWKHHLFVVMTTYRLSTLKCLIMFD